MAKKRLGNANLFGGESPSSISFEEADAKLFGEIAKVDQGRQVAKPISIFEISPDPTQPRRAIPSSIRALWNGDPQRLGALFGKWLDMAQAEKGTSVEIVDYLEGVKFKDDDIDDQSSSDGEKGPLEAALMQIVELAASIKRDGLTNPITVVQDTQQYRLETGERRWLAFHLLYAYFDDEKWAKIPARVVDEFNVWRQATENSARADLNAIGKARQFAILMMDLWANDPEKPVQFQPIEAFASEREFYAQVERLRPPYGKSGVLLNAIGAKDRAAFTRRRALLSLSDDVWQLADDYSFSEDALLKMAEMPEEEALQTAYTLIQNVATRNIVENSDLVPFDEVPENVGYPDKVMSQSPLIDRDHKKYMDRVWKMAQRATAGDTNFSDKDVEIVSKVRAWLDEVEQKIRDQRESKK